MSERVVLRMPLSELWDRDGVVPAARGPSVGAEEIRALLRAGPVRFVVAEPGLALLWVSGAEVFDFWKREVKPHLAPAAEGGFYLEAFPASMRTLRRGG